jgi:hypothetical protein
MTEQLLAAQHEQCRILRELVQMSSDVLRLASHVVTSGIHERDATARRNAANIADVFVRALEQLHKMSTRVARGLRATSERDPESETEREPKRARAYTSTPTPTPTPTPRVDVALSAAFSKTVSDRTAAFQALRIAGVDFNKPFLHGLRVAQPLFEALQQPHVTASELEWLLTEGRASATAKSTSGLAPLDVALCGDGYSCDVAKLHVLARHVPRAVLALPLQCGKTPLEIATQNAARASSVVEALMQGMKHGTSCSDSKL